MMIGNIKIDCSVSPEEFRQIEGAFDRLCKLAPHEELGDVLERSFGIFQVRVNGDKIIRYDVYETDGNKKRNRGYIVEDGKLVCWNSWKERILNGDK